jgi:two-component system, sensor histidine kinase and response regulator
MKKILLIEDNPRLRQQINLYLSRSNYICTNAMDGEEGIEMATGSLPDLILCDILLPSMSGFEVLEQLKSHPSTQLIPFILMSALADRANVRRGMSLGAEDYLTKPFTMAELKSAIDAAILRMQRISEAHENTMTRLRRNIVRVLPHELRTPMMGIIGYADMLHEDYDLLSVDQIRDFAASMVRSSRRLENVIETYIAYARLEVLISDPAARAAMLRDRCEVVEYITEAATAAANRYQREQDLIMNLQEATAAISPDNLSTVIDQLLDNAFKFSKPGTKVNVETRVLDDALEILVLDFGRGIPPQAIDKLGGAFMQFDRTDQQQEGSGLGLAITKRLVQLYGGTIAFKSRPRVETLVRVVLPLAQQPGEAPDDKDSTQPERPVERPTQPNRPENFPKDVEAWRKKSQNHDVD